ncbi:STP1 protein [Plasmodium malariae]|uniref:STP1 protein n=1 Tax=Plasmodium malariae TaxID=5858 RepID=A0A1D3JH80_PLAMA|nr:STP1 protein [Plasmodium malariae]SBT85508.1 STP1 protein [Plasmodium malariae]
MNVKLLWKINVYGLGSSIVEYIATPKFRRIKEHIRKRTTYLKTEKNKEHFRNECLQLAQYLINEKSAPQYVQQGTWEEGLKKWLQSNYNGLTKYGGCPMILEQNDKDLLNLSYQADDFCEQKKKYMKDLRLFLETPNIYKCNDTFCETKCNEFKVWFEVNKKNFESQSDFIKNNYKCYSRKKVFPTKACNVLNPNTFKNIPKCIKINPDVREDTEPKIETEITKKENDPVTPEIPSNSEEKKSKETLSALRNQKSPEPQVQDKAPSAAIKETTVSRTDQYEVTSSTQSGISEPSTASNSSRTEIQSQTTLQPLAHKIPRVQQSTQAISPSHQSSFPSSKYVTIPEANNNLGIINSTYIFIIFLTELINVYIEKFLQYSLIGRFKKKKKIKSRQVHFLRIQLPSPSEKKSEFLLHDYIQDPTYYDKGIVKNIKIYEHNLNKNISASKRKNRNKTIIEVHMEVLQNFKNEEWESNKIEFLEICLKELLDKNYGTSTNLANDKIVENTKNTSDFENKQILWNKWIERYGNVTEKLKKLEWFNNLKDEWKTEQAHLKTSEDLKTILSNENHKIPFMNYQKDMWRQWVSKKGKIIEQHLEHELFNGFEEEFQNIRDEYKNESLLSMEELENNQRHKKLKKYINIKLLKRLCILVLIMVLEECKKEEYIGNRESRMDSFINELITIENSDGISDITDNIYRDKGNVLEDRENLEIHGYKNKDCFIQELEDWLREDDANLNSTDDKNIAENIIK